MSTTREEGEKERGERGEGEGKPVVRYEPRQRRTTRKMTWGRTAVAALRGTQFRNRAATPIFATTSRSQLPRLVLALPNVPLPPLALWRAQT